MVNRRNSLAGMAPLSRVRPLCGLRTMIGATGFNKKCLKFHENNIYRTCIVRRVTFFVTKLSKKNMDFNLVSMDG